MGSFESELDAARTLPSADPGLGDAADPVPSAPRENYLCALPIAAVMRAAARASWPRTRCEHYRCWSTRRKWSSSAGGGHEGSAGDSALMSAVLGVDEPKDDRRWVRRPLESIPSPVDAS